MDDSQYSNRELDSKFDNLLGHMKVFEGETGGSLRRIEAQTIKTNGRVSKLEKWQQFVLGFCAAISVLIIPLIFIVIREKMLK